MAAGHVRKREHKDKDTGRVVRVSFQARYPDPEDPRRRIERTFSKRYEADRWLTAQRAAVDRGDHRDPRLSARTLESVADEWRETWLRLSPKTRAGYDAILDHWLLGGKDPLHPARSCAFRGLKVGQVTPKMVQAFVNDMSAKRHPNTVRRVYGVLRGVLKLAVARGYVATNACDAVELPRRSSIERHEQIILEPHEIDALVAATDEDYRLLVLTAAYTGLRSGELRGLRRKDVNLLSGTIRVEQALKEVHSSSDRIIEKGLLFGPPKSAASRRSVSLPAFLTEALREHLEGPLPSGAGPQALVFTTPSGTPIRQALFYRRFFKPAVRAALPPEKHGLRFHDLRHTCASLLIREGAHPAAIKGRLGHEKIATTIDVYGHLFPSVDEALGAMLDDLHTNAKSNVTPLRRADEG